MVRLSELRARDVINMTDGRNLGVLVDLEIDLERGRVVALVVPGQSRFLGLFGREQDLVIRWEEIVKIGEHVILVEMPAAGPTAPRGEAHR